MTRPDARPADAAHRPREGAPASARDRLPDHHDGRVVGEDEDSVLESIGKAVVAPVAGADGDAERPAPRPGASPRR